MLTDMFAAAGPSLAHVAADGGAVSGEHTEEDEGASVEPVSKQTLLMG